MATLLKGWRIVRDASVGVRFVNDLDSFFLRERKLRLYMAEQAVEVVDIFFHSSPPI